MFILMQITAAKYKKNSVEVTFLSCLHARFTLFKSKAMKCHFVIMHILLFDLYYILNAHSCGDGKIALQRAYKKHANHLLFVLHARRFSADNALARRN